MKRGVIDTLRRGLDSTIANWPLILIRFAESFVFVAITIVAAIAVVVPLLVSLGFSADLLRTPEGVDQILTSLAARWLLLFYILGVVSVLMVVFVAIHSFVEVGCARVYVDAERVAGAEMNGPRSRFDVFSIQRWATGASDGWWVLFWIYNLAWGLAAMVLLIPLAPMAVLAFVFQDNAPAMIATGCLGAVVFVGLAILVTLIVVIWSNRAIVTWARTRGTAREALAAGWAATKRDFGRLLLMSLALFVVSLAGSSFFASFSFLAGLFETLNDSAILGVATIPVRFAASIASALFSAIVSSWFLAAYAAIAVEEGR